jgi:excisionase family DNA binding protein
LAIEELSALWKVPKATIYNWVSQGRLPHLKLGRCLRFDPEEIRRFEERCKPISSGKR